VISRIVSAALGRANNNVKNKGAAASARPTMRSIR
jgi:hypothetical protein